MKKILIFLCLTIVAFGISAYSASYNVPEYIRIGIRFSDLAVTKAKIEVKNALSFSVRTGNVVSSAANFDGHKTVYIEKNPNFYVVLNDQIDSIEKALSLAKTANGFVGLENNKIVLFSAPFKTLDEAKNYLVTIKSKYIGARLSSGTGGFLISDETSVLLVFIVSGGTIPSISDSKNEPIGIDGVFYRGYLNFINNDSGKFTVVNFVLLQEYLYSVVPSEIGSSSPMEALKAQAVCARNYAIKNMGRFETLGYDLCNTVNSQVYKGVLQENARPTQAVNETKGVLLLYQEKIADTYFFANSGGMTEDCENVWVANVPYLTSVPSEFEKPYEWQVELTLDEITKKLNQKKYYDGVVTSVKIIERTKSGRVLKLLISGSTGDKVIEKERTRLAFDLKSQLYDFVSSTDYDVIASDLKPVKQKLSGLMALSKNGIFTLNSNIFIKTATVTMPLTTTTGDKIVIKGKGYGHGIGLSQQGAIGYAEQGYSFEDILKHYYLGTTLYSGTM